MRAFGLVLFVGLVAVETVGGQAREEKNYMRASLYPARVAQVNFSVPLNAARSICVDAWCAGFGPQAPVAEWEDARVFQFVYIRGLVCKNSVVGDRPCFLQFVYAEKGVGEKQVCSVQIPIVPPRNVDPNTGIVIDCPRSVVFDR